MKILVLASDKSGKFAPFVEEQIGALQQAGLQVIRYGVTGKGIAGYLRELPALSRLIRAERPDIIHAHYGLCGLLANLQRRVPVVTTYHGCDINTLRLRVFSSVSLALSEYNIFVSRPQANKIQWLGKRRSTIIACGVDADVFRPLNKEQARLQFNMLPYKRYVLFSSTFSRVEKNANLASKAIALMSNVELIELDGYTREEVVVLMNAVDAGVLTSIREGSPQFAKEMLACHRPIVSTNVGDVIEQFAGVKGAYISEFDARDVADKLETAIADGNAELPSGWFEKYENKHIVNKLIEIYKSIIK